MGSHYRNREGRTAPASTLSSDLAGLGAAPPEQAADVNLDDMTKDQLLEHAQNLGVTPANASMTKAELRDAIDTA
jgi:hypothetical protein